MYSNLVFAETAEVPFGVVTIMSTVPALFDGDVAVIDVSESTVNATAEVLPNCTAVAPVKLLPVIVTSGSAVN